MKTMLCVCLLAVLLPAMEKPAIEGRWEGETNGLKAITLTVHEARGAMEGSAIFYVLRDDDGKGLQIVGQDERKLLDAHWDGKTLRFAVGAPDFDPDGPGARFTMTVTGDRKAELKRADGGAMTLALARVD